MHIKGVLVCRQTEVSSRISSEEVLLIKGKFIPFTPNFLLFRFFLLGDSLLVYVDIHSPVVREDYFPFFSVQTYTKKKREFTS